MIWEEKILKLLKKIRESELEKISMKHFAGIILVILVFYPMFIKGIMCNDELLLRLWSQKGIKSFFQTTIYNEYILKGRVLGAIGNLKFMSFLSDNKYIFGLINSAFLFLSIVLFGYLTYKILKNREFSILLCVLISIFLPINFEFAVPNAFVIVCLEPMIILECSLIIYIDYLDNYNRKKFFVSIGLFLWSMFLYEFLITYVLLFPAIYIIKNIDKKISIKKVIYASFPWVTVSVIYLILYFLQGYLFPSNYEGTHLSFNSLTSILNVLKILFVAVFPTYFSYFNDKYKYLFELYNSGNVTFENVFNPIIIIFGLSLFVLLFLTFLYVTASFRSTVHIPAGTCRWSSARSPAGGSSRGLRCSLTSLLQTACRRRAGRGRVHSLPRARSGNCRGSASHRPEQYCLLHPIQIRTWYLR